MQDTCSTLALGKALEAAGDYKQALDAYLAAFRTGAAGVEIEALLFREDFLLKTYPHSIIGLSTLAGWPESAPVWRLLARVCERKGDYELALAFASKAQQENPHDVASLSILARLSERQQKMAEAAEWHRRLLAVAPPNVRVSYRFLAQFYHDQAEYQAARPYWEHLARSEPANRVYQLSWLLARIHTCGIHGVQPPLAEVERWQDFTLEERSLAHELFLTAGKASLDEDLAMAEQYGLQALCIAQSADGTSFLAEVEQRKAEQPCDHGMLSQFPPSTQKEPPQPLKPLSPERLMEQVLFVSMQESRQIRQARRREVLQRIGKRAAIFLLLIGGLVGFATLYETSLSFPLREKMGIKGEEQGIALLPEKPPLLSPPDTTGTTEKGSE